MKRRRPRLKRTKDYYPLTNPDQLQGKERLSVPSEEDIERAKNWVDNGSQL